jgi:hypothetical protein
VQVINSQFAELLQTGGDEDQGQAEEGEDPGRDSKPGEDFRQRWGWIANIDDASATCRISWDEMFRKPAIEFLNILAYRKDRAERDKADLEQWKKDN